MTYRALEVDLCGEGKLMPRLIGEVHRHQVGRLKRPDVVMGCQIGTEEPSEGALPKPLQTAAQKIFRNEKMIKKKIQNKRRLTKA